MIETLQANLKEINQRIAAAAARSGRAADQITLVAVTKYVDAPTTGMMFDAGCHTLGESRPQQLWDKASELQDKPIAWHLIGHLQRNKVKRTLPLVDLIHSVDSERLLRAIDKASADAGLKTSVLLEVNISGDSAKHGLSAVQVTELLQSAGDFNHVQINGLMGMAGLHGDQDDARSQFASLRAIRELADQQSLPDNVSLTELSMGMSNDFELAIEEGATIVRVGSALFKGCRPK
jgi:pyridoxal phosphate enzyme (YggS family)